MIGKYEKHKEYPMGVLNSLKLFKTTWENAACRIQNNPKRPILNEHDLQAFIIGDLEKRTDYSIFAEVSFNNGRFKPDLLVCSKTDMENLFLIHLIIELKRRGAPRYLEDMKKLARLNQYIKSGESGRRKIFLINETTMFISASIGGTNAEAARYDFVKNKITNWTGPKEFMDEIFKNNLWLAGYEDRADEIKRHGRTTVNPWMFKYIDIRDKSLEELEKTVY